jgi:hypothetical protein
VPVAELSLDHGEVTIVKVDLAIELTDARDAIAKRPTVYGR